MLSEICNNEERRKRTQGP